MLLVTFKRKLFLQRSCSRHTFVVLEDVHSDFSRIRLASVSMDQMKAEILKELREEIQHHTSLEANLDSLVHSSARISNSDEGPSSFALQNFGFGEDDADKASSTEKTIYNAGMFVFPVLEFLE